MVPEDGAPGAARLPAPGRPDLHEGGRRSALGADQGGRARRAGADRGPLLQRRRTWRRCASSCGRIEVVQRQASVTTSERIRQMYMHLGERLGPKLAEVLPGLIDSILQPAMSEAVARLRPGAPRGLPALPRAHGRGRPLLPDRAGALRRLPAAGEGHPRLDAELRGAVDRRLGDLRVGERARLGERARGSPRAPALIAAGRGRQLPGRRALLRRCEVRYDTVFLRWDKTQDACSCCAPRRGPAAWTARRRWPSWSARPRSRRRRSIDWWRQVGAAIRFADGERRGGDATSTPAPARAPTRPATRAANFFKGVHLELSTATTPRRG